jgi:tetratricopeptide (TPR) repeat protein
MRTLFEQGVVEAQAALAVDPKLSEAYGLLIQEKRADAGARNCYEAGESALKQVPASYAIRLEVMSCLQPRWGGSYEAMDLYAQRAQLFVHQNLRLAALKGFADADRGCWEYRPKGLYGPAIAALTRAIAEGGDAPSFYRCRGETFAALGQHPDALEDLRRADQLWPQYPATLELLAKVLLWSGDDHNALNQINLALSIGGLTPAEEQV